MNGATNRPVLSAASCIQVCVLTAHFAVVLALARVLALVLRERLFRHEFPAILTLAVGFRVYPDHVVLERRLVVEPLAAQVAPKRPLVSVTSLVLYEGVLAEETLGAHFTSKGAVFYVGLRL